MAQELPEVDFRRLWTRLQTLGLNAYEARTYLVLLGSSRFKALDLAGRAGVPRQKIYEILDSLAEKGFTQVVQDRTKLFSAVAPDQAIAGYLAARARAFAAEQAEQTRSAGELIGELQTSLPPVSSGRNSLDYVRIVNDPQQTAVQFRKWLAEAQTEYLEFSRPPHAIQPQETSLVISAYARGVRCRMILEPAASPLHSAEYARAGLEYRMLDTVPLKLALFDAKRGMLALLDPVLARPAWTTIVFEHAGMGEAMKVLFEQYWQLASTFTARA